MRRQSLLIGAITVVIIITCVTSIASANRLSLTEKNFEFIWNNELTLASDFTVHNESGSSFNCKLTLLGSFTANTIAKRTTANQGTITHGSLSECALTLGTETLPWGLRYRSFSGSLPHISGVGIAILGMTFKLESACEISTEEEQPFVGIFEQFASEGVPDNIKADETHSIRSFSLSCPFLNPWRFSGLGVVRNLARSARITIFLI